MNVSDWVQMIVKGDSVQTKAGLEIGDVGQVVRGGSGLFEINFPRIRRQLFVAERRLQVIDITPLEVGDLVRVVAAPVVPLSASTYFPHVKDCVGLVKSVKGIKASNGRLEYEVDFLQQKGIYTGVCWGRESFELLQRPLNSSGTDATAMVTEKAPTPEKRWYHSSGRTIQDLLRDQEAGR